MFDWLDLAITTVFSGVESIFGGGSSGGGDSFFSRLGTSAIQAGVRTFGDRGGSRSARTPEVPNLSGSMVGVTDKSGQGTRVPVPEISDTMKAMFEWKALMRESYQNAAATFVAPSSSGISAKRKAAEFRDI